MDCCNARRSGHAHLPKMEAGEWAGKGYCKRRAGWGTDHPSGRCSSHGGASEGAPERNKNAVTTGEHETIYTDRFDEKQRARFGRISTDPLQRIDEQLRLCVFRMDRMMARIERLREEEYTTPEIIKESGQRAEGPVDLLKEKREATLGQIQQIEEAITRLEGRHARLVKLRHRVADQDAESEELARLLERMDALADGHADDYQTPEVG